MSLDPILLALLAASIPLAVLVWRRFWGTPFGRALTGLVVALFFLIPHYIELEFASWVLIRELAELVAVLAALAVAVNFVRLFVGDKRWR